jgi:hypothetical protein
MPTLIVSSARAAVTPKASAPPTSAPVARKNKRLVNDMTDLIDAPVKQGRDSLAPTEPETPLATSVPPIFWAFALSGAAKASAGAKEMYKGQARPNYRRLGLWQRGNRRGGPS